MKMIVVCTTLDKFYAKNNFRRLENKTLSTRRTALDFIPAPLLLI